MTLQPQFASTGEDRPDAADRSAPGASADPFVINLCSSTTPMALAHPDAPELKRFRFFVSRRLEDGRERFRLHMGYFESLEEAEEWLSVVRDVYPGAWAGEAPGKRLRARQAAAADPTSPSVRPPPTIEPVKVAASGAALPASMPTAPIAGPVKEAAVSVAARRAPAPPAPIVEPAKDVAAFLAARPLPPPSPPTLAPTTDVEASPAARPVTRPPAPKVGRPRDAATTIAARTPVLGPLSNVREVMAALDETGGTRKMPAPATVRATPSARQEPPTLSDTQVMKILEERRTDERARADSHAANSDISLLRPDDTQTRRALKEAVQQNAPVFFAVQLQWSVQPLALDKVPPLAIFSAYTLYTVEGSREGRKWFGLRLGFFTDAIAAKQVAHYVRSEFTSVAVVPVSSIERGRATVADKKIVPTTSIPEVPRAAQDEEIKLLDTPATDASPRAPPASQRAAAKLPSGRAKTSSPAARAAASRSKKLRGKVRSEERKAPYSLEETLEILGAGNLELDNGRGELVNDSGVRHLRVEVRKNSSFSRLVARLTERARKN
jgi:hypothetical protein